jgi:hypothetical protein
MRATLLAIAALAALAGVAHAQVITPAQNSVYTAPSVPSTYTIGLGPLTLTGFGGYATPVLVQATGSPCTSPTITSETNGSAGASTDIALDQNCELVPCASGTFACSTYGGSPVASMNFPYTVNETDSAGNKAIVTVNSLGATYASIEPHQGYAFNPDTSSLFQLKSALQKSGTGALVLGSTVSSRNGGVNDLDSSSAYQINNTAWTGSGRITVTCDNQFTAAVDQYGNNTYGGGCRFGKIDFDSFGLGDVAMPLDFRYVSFYINSASWTSGPMVGYSNKAHGINYYNPNLSVGPLTPTSWASSAVGIAYTNYGGTDNANCGATIDHGFFSNVGTAIAVKASATTINCPGTITHNTLANVSQKGISVFAAAANVVNDNFAYGLYAVGGNHGDFIIETNSNLSLTNTPGPQYLRNIAVHGPAGLTAIYAVTWTPGTPPANGSYPDQLVSGGSGQNGALDVTVSGGVVTATGANNVGGSGGSQGGGRGYKVGDALTATVGGISQAFTVTSLSYAPDVLGIFSNLGSCPCDTSTGETQTNNIIIMVNGDSSFLEHANSAVVNYNDFPGDFNSAPLQYAAAQTTKGSITANDGANGSFDNNTTNAYSLTVTGSPTCYPSTPTLCTSADIPATNAGAIAVWPGFSTTFGGVYTRAAVIAAQTPAYQVAWSSGGGGAWLANGSYRTALTPADSNGKACWNNGLTNFDNTKTCVAQGLTPAT